MYATNDTNRRGRWYLSRFVPQNRQQTTPIEEEGGI
jgi:hypothetical protein